MRALAFAICVGVTASSASAQQGVPRWQRGSNRSPKGEHKIGSRHAVRQ